MSLEKERGVIARERSLVSSATGGLSGKRTAIAFDNQGTEDVFRAISVT